MVHRENGVHSCTIHGRGSEGNVKNKYECQIGILNDGNDFTKGSILSFEILEVFAITIAITVLVFKF